MGLALDNVAFPPLIDNVKSETSKSPLPLVELYTAVDIVTEIALLSDDIVVLLMVGAVLSTLIVAPLVGVVVTPLPTSSFPVAKAQVWVPSPLPTVQI